LAHLLSNLIKLGNIIKSIFPSIWIKDFNNLKKEWLVSRHNFHSDRSIYNKLNIRSNQIKILLRNKIKIMSMLHQNALIYSSINILTLLKLNLRFPSLTKYMDKISISWLSNYLPLFPCLRIDNLKSRGSSILWQEESLHSLYVSIQSAPCTPLQDGIIS
jgi:hypothetical protein